MKKALIILGHGSKAPEATETLAAVTGMVERMVDYDRVAFASLQISKPGLGEVVEELRTEGFEKIMVIPFLIAVGQHVKEDIPDELKALREKYPGLELYLGAPLGADQRLAEIVSDRVRELERSL